MPIYTQKADLTLSWNPNTTVFVDSGAFLTIQEAIDYAENLVAADHVLGPSLPVPGVSVMIPAGYFDEDIVIRKQIALVGQGREATFIKSITSRPSIIETTGDISNGSPIITNIPDTTEMQIGDRVKGSGIPDNAAINTIDSSTQITLTLNATANTTGVSLIFSCPITSQGITNLATETLNITSETNSSSGIYFPILGGHISGSGGFQFSGCFIETLNASNVSNIVFNNSEVFGTATFLNIITMEISNSLLATVIINGDDTDPGFNPAATAFNIYCDVSSIYAGLSVDKLAGTIAPIVTTSGCYLSSYSAINGSTLTILGDAFSPTNPGDWTSSPTNENAALDELAARPAPSTILTSSITNGDTTHAPTGDAVFDALALKAPLASPTLTGIPLAPTASPGTNNTQLATTAYADALISDIAYDDTSWNGVTGIGPSKNAVRDKINSIESSISGLVIDSIADLDTTHAPSRNSVFDALALKADLANPALTGNPTAPTQSAGTNNTTIATTAYADALVSDTAYAASWNGVTGISPSKNVVYDQMELKAPLASPTLTGTPTSPTASINTNSTQIATTEYVDRKVLTKVLTIQKDISSATAAKVTNLDQATGTGSFVFQYFIRYQSTASGTGVKFSVNHSGTVTSFVYNVRWVDASATASTAAPDQDATGAAGHVVGAFAARAKGTAGLSTTISVDTQNADMLMIIEGMFECTVNGNLELYHGSEGAVQTSVMVGTMLILTKGA